jgi:hypothetical protein
LIKIETSHFPITIVDRFDPNNNVAYSPAWRKLHHFRGASEIGGS